MANTLVDGDDGLPVEPVGPWAKDKHAYLKRYLDISRGARRKYIGSGKPGATFVDLFSSVGRSRIEDTGEMIDGSSVAAWKISGVGNAPFSGVYVADIIADRRKIAAERLRRCNAPVVELEGDAVSAARAYCDHVDPYGLHFAFLDPHGLGTLDFQIIKALSEIKRIDLLIHVSAMDLQRNLAQQIRAEESAQFDAFAPGWREAVDTRRPASVVRGEILEHWRKLVKGLGLDTAAQAPLISGGSNQRLYWLMLASRNELATDLWKKVVTDLDDQKMLL